MTTRKTQLYFVMTVLAVALAGGVYFAHRHRSQSAQRVEARIRTWHEGPRIMTRLMMQRYGPPVLAGGAATWFGRGPWKRIVVHADTPDDYLEQTVSYAAPSVAAAALSEFGRVRLDFAKDEMTAASNSETMNRLALNLADEVVRGTRTAEEARDFFARTAKLEASGKTSPYLTKLLFTPYKPPREDPRRRGVGY